MPLALPVRRGLPVVIPSYNGSRKMPNLVPLLALLLAREGIAVLVHGLPQEPQRVTTFDVLQALGHGKARSLEQAAQRLDADHLAAVPLELLSPALARVADARLATGVRNCAHTLAKLLLPSGTPARQACRLVPVTHPDFLELVRAYLGKVPGDAFLMRGMEGEAVVRLHAPQPIEHADAEGRFVTHLLPEAAVSELPARDVDSTAAWTRDVLEGRHPVPESLARPVALIANHCREAAHLAREPLRIVR
jgi:anthranilate phosphoribosyltransferase